MPIPSDNCSRVLRDDHPVHVTMRETVSINAEERGYYIQDTLSQYYLYEDGLIRDNKDDDHASCFWETGENALRYWELWRNNLL